MGMVQEFKEFAVKGSAIDLAVGVIIGAAFGKIVTSLVDDIIMPPIGLLLGKVDFTNLYVSLTGPHPETLADAKKAGAATLNYGLFLNNLLNFVIVAFVVFLMVRQIVRLKRAPVAEAVPDTRKCPYCMSAISLEATRCPNCTSDLTTAPATA